MTRACCTTLPFVTSVVVLSIESSGEPTSPLEPFASGPSSAA
jgi:hypothetical protein